MQSLGVQQGVVPRRVSRKSCILDGPGKNKKRVLDLFDREQLQGTDERWPLHIVWKDLVMKEVQCTTSPVPERHTESKCLTAPSFLQNLVPVVNAYPH